MGVPLRVLIVEDREDDAALLIRELQRGDYVPQWERVDTPEALAAALDTPWDVIVSDFRMPRLTGPQALAICQQRRVETPFIIVSGTVGEEEAVAALKAGAGDFINKSNLVRLCPAVARELRDQAERRARKKAEAQLQQAQKMEAIGLLAGGVAHDFNNLLGVIVGNTELLLRSLGPDHPGKTRLEQTLKAAERSAGLTRQLLTFSRKQVVSPRVLDLNQIVPETVQMLRRLIGEDIDLHFVPGADLGKVRADPGEMEQVVMNLAVNARDAMREGGRLTIETRNVTLGEEDTQSQTEVSPGRYVMLTVSDTGSGIPLEIQARIFEPFFTTKEPGKGTGLGLSTVYGIVKQSSGHMSFSSVPNQGTSFTMLFPRVDAITELPPEPSSSSMPSGTETVLVVEDEESLRLIVAEVLQDCGYTVLDARDGMEALRIADLHKGPIDLLMTDVVMPNMSGRELFERLSELRPETKVLFVSGYTDDAMVRRGVLSAHMGFLQKPFTSNALGFKIRAVLDSSGAQ